MKVLMLNGGKYAAAFRELGHEVSSFSQGTCKLGEGIDRDRYCIAEAIAHTGCEPDLIVVELFGPRCCVRGIEGCEIPLVATVFDSSFNHFWLRHYLRAFDHVFVDFASSVPRLAEEGIEAHWAPYSIDPALFELRDVEAEWDVGFVGVTEGRPRRQALIELLSREFDVRIAGALSGEARVPEDRQADHYARSRIVINEYLFDGVNFRVFEALASGAFLLTPETGNGLAALFDDGVHLATYRPETVVDRVRELLAEPEARAAMARAGRARVLERHSRLARAREMLAVIERRPPGRARRDVYRRAANTGRALLHFTNRWPSFAAQDLPHAGGLLRFALSGLPREGAVHWALARVGALGGDLTGAAARLSRAAELCPEEPLVRFHLGHVLLELRETERAVIAFAEGLACCRAANPEAVRLALGLVEERRFDAALWLVLGHVLDSMGVTVEPNASSFEVARFPSAPNEYFNRALQEGDLLDAILALADCYARAGDDAIAFQLYEMAIARGAKSAHVLMAAAIENLASFRRERGLGLLRQAIAEDTALLAYLDRIPLAKSERDALAVDRARALSAQGGA